MPQCKGKTSKGERCKRLAKSGNFCFQHDKAVRPPKTKIEKLALVISISSGSAAFFDKMFDVVGYVTTHWQELGRLLESFIVVPPKDPIKVIEGLRGVYSSRVSKEDDFKMVTRRFNRWFMQLPPNVQKNVIARYGILQIEALRNIE